MKTILLVVVALACFVGNALAVTAYPDCSTLTVSPVGGCCWDSTHSAIYCFNGATMSLLQGGTISGTSPISVSAGGVISIGAPYGATSYTAHGIVLGEGASNLGVTAACATGTFIYGQGASADPICSTLVMPNAATTGDLLEATSANTIGSLVDVATGSVLVSHGVGAVPVYSISPVLGIPGTSSGSLTISNFTGAGQYTLASAANTTSYTETAKAVVPAQGDILDYSNGSGQRSSLVDVAVGQLLTSGGVGAVPTYSNAPVLGVAASQAGTLGLAKGAVGGSIWTLASAATSAWTLTGAATAPAQGDLFTFSNGTGQMASVADVATGELLASGGTSTVPAYTATPTLGTAASVPGTLGLAKGVGGGAVWTLASAATSNWTITGAATAPAQGDLQTFSNGTGQMASVADVAVGQVLESKGVGAAPGYNGTAPSTSGQVFSMTTAGVGSWLATEAHIGNAGAYGNSTNFPTGSIAIQTKANNAGHFVSLTINNQSLNGGSCSTAPTFNIFDGASNTGTAQIASATKQGTRGTTTNVAQTQTFAAGDIIGIYVSTQGATCLAPTFSVDATVTYP